MSVNTNENRAYSDSSEKPKKSTAKLVIKILCYVLCAVLGLGTGVSLYV